MVEPQESQRDPLEEFLDQQQRAWRCYEPQGHQRSTRDVLALALGKAKAREEAYHRDGNWLRSGRWFFSASLERRRLQHTRTIIERTNPGELDVPEMIEIMARQAASIEMYWCRENEEKDRDLCSYLESTRVAWLPNPTFDGRSLSESYFQQSGIQYVQYSLGLTSFLYAVSSAVVLSWPKTETGGFSPDHNEIARHMEQTSVAQMSFLLSLQDWLLKGKPRLGETVPDSYAAAFEQQLLAAERFVVAHEYGHLIQSQVEVRTKIPSFKGPKQWETEFLADGLGFIALIESYATFDKVDPVIAAQGAFLALEVLALIPEIRALVIHGKNRRDQGSGSHPPVSERRKALKDLMKIYLSSRMPEEKIEKAIHVSEISGWTLRQLWKRVRPHFEKPYWRTSDLHPMWYGSRECPGDRRTRG